MQLSSAGVITLWNYWKQSLKTPTPRNQELNVT